MGPGVLDAEGVKHIAVQARSTSSRKAAYTATGLGDRIHTVTLGWAFARKHGVPVILHLTKSKQIGGQFNNKPESWREIASLFPPGAVSLAMHDHEPATEREWLTYLERRNIPGEPYWYGDHPGRLARPVPLDISSCLRDFPRLSPDSPNETLDLPERFVTVQWDSNDAKRTLEPSQRVAVNAVYRELGYELLTVGGEAVNPLLRHSLAHVAYAMSNAAMHVGVDSAFMHMAFLYLPFERIHLYGTRDGFRSHHLKRALDNGCVWSPYFRA